MTFHLASMTDGLNNEWKPVPDNCGCWYKNSIIETLCPDHFEHWRITFALHLDGKDTPLRHYGDHWIRQLIKKNWR